MAAWQAEFTVTLTNTWVKVLDANQGRRFLTIAPVSTFYDAYWSSNPDLDGTSAAGGFPLSGGEDFGLVADAAPQGAIYMRSASGEQVSIRQGS